MRKTTVIVALAIGATGAVAQPRLAAAQQPEAQPSSPAPAQPTEPPTSPPEPATAPPAAGDLPVPPGPARGSPDKGGAEPGAEGNAAAPLGRTLFPNPSLDTDNLKKQGEQRPDARRDGSSVSLESIFAEDWWSHARPLFEFHGYFRTRSELFYNFALGRRDDPTQALYPQPVDNQYTSIAGNMTGNSVGPLLCTAGESDAVPQGQGPLRGCRSKTQAGANMRFRLSPTLHISDNLRIHTQIDMLDNLVLGSTPEGYAISPASVGGGYQVLPRSGYSPIGGLDQTQVPPTAGVNGLQNSIAVKRAWAEFTTPLGEARFGRMPNNWGLGMLYNAGDGYDDDYQSTVDRLMFVSGIKPLDLVIAAMWDFPNEGVTTSIPVTGGEQYDAGQQDDVSEYGLMILHNKSPELTKLELSRGSVIFNSGLYVTYRDQRLANDQPGNSSSGANVPYADQLQLRNAGFARRGLSMWTPDVWLQLLYKKFRVETEIAAVLGSVESMSVTPNGSDFLTGDPDHRKIRQYGFAFELQQKLVEDRLRLNFKSGWASGDSAAYDPNNAGNLIPGAGQQEINSNTLSTFRFNPSYRIDSILNRYILQRIQGTYYFNPSLDYDFTRQPNGQKIGGGVNVTWTRASEFVQTPGHAADLGLELGGSLYFQSKDGALNDDITKMGGFFAQLQYSVLFPLAGLGYEAVTKQQLGVDTSAAQLVRLYLGVMF